MTCNSGSGACDIFTQGRPGGLKRKADFDARNDWGSMKIAPLRHDLRDLGGRLALRRCASGQAQAQLPEFFLFAGVRARPQGPVRAVVDAETPRLPAQQAKHRRYILQMIGDHVNDAALVL